MLTQLLEKSTKVEYLLPGTRNVKYIGLIELYGIPKDKCIIYGSAVLALHGIRENRDLDVMATKDILKRLRNNKNFIRKTSKFDGSTYYETKDGKLSIFEGPFPLRETTEELLNPKYLDKVDGFNFLKIEMEKIWKLKAYKFIAKNGINYDNVKNLEDIKLIDKYLKKENIEKMNTKQDLVDFVLQKHLAKVAGEHLDLRIEIPTNRRMMASWAIPRAVIPKTGGKVLAVRTNDHGQRWKSFEGTIEKGYGAGLVKIVQRGKVLITLWTESHIVFEIKNGKPLNGKYALVKFGKVRNRDQSAWLLIKMNE